MRWRILQILVFGVILAAGPAGRADECFCLIQPPTGTILRGCEAYKAPADYYLTAVCTDPQSGQKSEQTMYSDWQRIEAGADLCNPCRRSARGVVPEVPRKPGKTPQP